MDMQCRPQEDVHEDACSVLHHQLAQGVEGATCGKVLRLFKTQGDVHEDECSAPTRPG
ncbi:unnamed protein product, partial [Closterium sp. NIES-64]